jgi:hypothetical protein
MQRVLAAAVLVLAAVVFEQWRRISGLEALLLAEQAAALDREARLTAREALWSVEEERIRDLVESLNTTVVEGHVASADAAVRYNESADRFAGLAEDIRSLVLTQEKQLAHQTMAFIYDWFSNSGLRDEIDELKARLPAA